MNRLGSLARRLLLLSPFVLTATAALARGGGGHSYSGGSQGGSGHSYSSGTHGGGGFSGGSDDGGVILLVLELLFRYPKIGVTLLVVAIVLFVKVKSSTAVSSGFSTGDAGALYRTASSHAAGVGRPELEALRQADPDYSEPLFLDFVAALAARAVAVAGTPRLAEVERYLADSRVLLPFGAGGWRNVVVGSTRLRSVAVGADAIRIAVDVALAATGAAGGRWWQTTWTFTRKAGVHSKGPAEITKLACPACGAGSERREDGACQYCGQKPAPGEAAWAALTVLVTRVEARPPIVLGGYAEERGTELPTVKSPALAADLARLTQRLPDFDWAKARDRFGRAFLGLQHAWSERDVAGIRPLATDAVFSTWRYWIEAYRVAGLRNRLQQIEVRRIDAARVSLDKYYAAITARIFASMVDQTVDDGGRVVDGQTAPRIFTEYWTFVRTLAAARTDGVTCSGCGASLPAGQTGQCPYCGALVGAPAFDWILSRIDQDEDYTGA
jgi:hypothetical protein